MQVLLHIEEVPESEHVRAILCNTGYREDSNIASNKNSAAPIGCRIELTCSTEPHAEAATNIPVVQLFEQPAQPISGCAHVSHITGDVFYSWQLGALCKACGSLPIKIRWHLFLFHSVGTACS